MPTPNSFDYAVIRVVPFVQREEFFNAGVILFCPQQRFLEARIYLDHGKLQAIAPATDIADTQTRLEAIVKICQGDHTAGSIARISQRARFHWLVSPRSTLLQLSPVHSGLCDEPAPVLNRLFGEQVLAVGQSQACPPFKKG